MKLKKNVLNAQKDHFYAIYDEFGIFPIFNFCPIWIVQKVFLAHFSAFLTKIWPKNIYQITQTQNLKFDFFEILTFDDLQLAKGQKDLGREGGT